MPRREVRVARDATLRGRHPVAVEAFELDAERRARRLAQAEAGVVDGEIAAAGRDRQHERLPGGAAEQGVGLVEDDALDRDRGRR